jgi:peptidoglycan/xylan/chitin deacetylase (PgdA/CDA1 family)
MDTGSRYVEHRHEISEPVVALTFDDGPSEWTDPIVEHLRRHGATATFFVIGSAIDKSGGETLRNAAAAGCEIANHTYSHRLLPSLAEDEIRDELVRTSARIEEVATRPPSLWRAPHFRSDERIRALAAGLGLLEVRCSVFTGDYAWPALKTAAWVLHHLRPGAIVDLHDGRPQTDTVDDAAPTREATVEAVGRILGEMETRGYRSVTVSELLAIP